MGFLVFLVKKKHAVNNLKAHGSNRIKRSDSRSMADRCAPDSPWLRRFALLGSPKKTRGGACRPW
jgi:hypothetical protein